MLQLEEALSLITSVPASMTSETVGLGAALGRLLAQGLDARLDQPPFDKAAMDGWLWLSRDGQPPEAGLHAREVLAAGSDPSLRPLGPGEAIRIMTGAALPPLATESNPELQPWIQRIEWAETVSGPDGKTLVRFSRREGCDNIIKRGENARAGQRLLRQRLLRAQDLAVLAADGRAELAVATRPRVGVFSTGTELREPGQELLAGQIYDSNRPQLLAQLAAFPCLPIDLGVLPDDYEATLAAVRQAMDGYDLVLLSGGVSMGDFDYVPRALIAAGVQTIFHGVAMKPGRPSFFGRCGSCYVLGLPGNPVSVFVNTEVLVKPLLAALCGQAWQPRQASLPLAQALGRRDTSRAEFMPVRIGPDGVERVDYGGSSAIQALTEADGFICLPAGLAGLEKGDRVDVRFVW